MPQAGPTIPPETWSLIQHLYFNGLGPKEIAKQTGVKADTISCRASRSNWKRLVDQANGILQEAKPGSPVLAPNSLSRASTNARKRLSDIIEAALDVIEPPRNPKRALELQAKLEPLVRNAKIVHSWSENSTEPAVRINLLASTAVVQVGDAARPSIDSQVQDKHSFPAQTLPEATGQPPFDQGV